MTNIRKKSNKGSKIKRKKSKVFDAGLDELTGITGKKIHSDDKRVMQILNDASSVDADPNPAAGEGDLDSESKATTAVLGYVNNSSDLPCSSYESADFYKKALPRTEQQSRSNQSDAIQLKDGKDNNTFEHVIAVAVLEKNDLSLSGGNNPDEGTHRHQICADDEFSLLPFAVHQEGRNLPMQLDVTSNLPIKRGDPDTILGGGEKKTDIAQSNTSCTIQDPRDRLLASLSRRSPEQQEEEKCMMTGSDFGVHAKMEEIVPAHDGKSLSDSEENRTKVEPSLVPTSRFLSGSPLVAGDMVVHFTVKECGQSHAVSFEDVEGREKHTEHPETPSSPPAFLKQSVASGEVVVSPVRLNIPDVFAKPINTGKSPNRSSSHSPKSPSRKLVIPAVLNSPVRHESPGKSPARKLNKLPIPGAFLPTNISSIEPLHVLPITCAGGVEGIVAKNEKTVDMKINESERVHRHSPDTGTMKSARRETRAKGTPSADIRRKSGAESRKKKKLHEEIARVEAELEAARNLAAEKKDALSPASEERLHRDIARAENELENARKIMSESTPDEQCSPSLESTCSLDNESPPAKQISVVENTASGNTSDVNMENKSIEHSGDHVDYDGTDLSVRAVVEIEMDELVIKSLAATFINQSEVGESNDRDDEIRDTDDDSVSKCSTTYIARELGIEDLDQESTEQGYIFHDDESGDGMLSIATFKSQENTKTDVDTKTEVNFIPDGGKDYAVGGKNNPRKLAGILDSLIESCGEDSQYMRPPPPVSPSKRPSPSSPKNVAISVEKTMQIEQSNSCECIIL